MLKPFNMSQDVSIGRAWWHGRPSDILWCHPSEPLCLSCSRSTGTKRCSKSLGAVDMVSWAVRKQAEFGPSFAPLNLISAQRNLRPKGRWTKAKVHMNLETWWDFDGMLICWNIDCLETWQDLSPWPSASNTASKCPGSWGGGVRVKNHSVGLRPAPPLAEARVTPASYR